MLYGLIGALLTGGATYFLTANLGLSLLFGFGGYITGDYIGNYIEKHEIGTATPEQTIRAHPEYNV